MNILHEILEKAWSEETVCCYLANQFILLAFNFSEVDIDHLGRPLYKKFNPNVLWFSFQ